MDILSSYAPRGTPAHILYMSLDGFSLTIPDLLVVERVWFIKSEIRIHLQYYYHNDAPESTTP